MRETIRCEAIRYLLIVFFMILSAKLLIKIESFFINESVPETQQVNPGEIE